MDQIITCYKDMWVNWNNFSGRTSRSAFWYAWVTNMVVSFVLSLLEAVASPLGLVADIFTLIVFIPSIALAVRRLHDTSHSGWWYLLALTGIGAIVLLVWFFQDSHPDNKYGPSPKGYSAAPGGYPSYPSYPTYPQGPQEGGYNNDNGNGPELK